MYPPPYPPQKQFPHCEIPPQGINAANICGAPAIFGVGIPLELEFLLSCADCLSQAVTMKILEAPGRIFDPDLVLIGNLFVILPSREEKELAC